MLVSKQSRPARYSNNYHDTVYMSQKPKWIQVGQVNLIDQVTQHNKGQQTLHWPYSHHLQIIKWYLDAAFAMYPDFQSHMGDNMTFWLTRCSTVNLN